MASGGREQKRPTVQWFWEVHCKNEPQYNGFGKSTAKTTDCTMVWGGRLQKRPPVQWFWEVDCQTDRRSHGFRRSTSFAHFSETTTGGEAFPLARRRRGRESRLPGETTTSGVVVAQATRDEEGEEACILPSEMCAQANEEFSFGAKRQS